MFFIAYSITLPISFKMGVEKSRYIYIVILSGMGAAVFGLVKILNTLGILKKIDGSDGAETAVILGMLVVSVLVLVISYRISIRSGDKQGDEAGMLFDQPLLAHPGNFLHQRAAVHGQIVGKVRVRDGQLYGRTSLAQGLKM